MDINWRVRAKNPAFWAALVPAVLVLAQVILAACGVIWDPTEWTGKILAIVDAVFVLLAILGVVVDPTTEGYSDSKRALGYDQPAPNIKED